jgi:hypothetical protein
MSKKQIGKFSLKNNGGFVVKLQFGYYDDDGNKHHLVGTDDITLGLSKTADPGNYGVPDGADVFLYAFVVWGTDNEAKQMFTYKKDSPVTAHYVIDGTTLNNELGLISVG